MSMRIPIATRAARPRPVRQSDYEALASFRYGLRQFLRFSEEAAQGAGLTPQQHQALLAIQGFGGAAGATVGDLAERLQIRHHSAVGLVDRLVGLHLVRREAGAVDRRRVYVRLTTRGHSVLARLSAVHRDELSRIAPGLQRLLRHIKRAQAEHA